MSSETIAFLSYTRADDDADNGVIARFAERLSTEVHVQLGKPFPIFSHQDSIEWGENWRNRVDKSLTTAALLIPVLTPSFFNSTACRNELKKFLERERELSRDDLVLPIYYVTCKLDDGDVLKETVFGRQYVDWRDLRFESFNSPGVRRELHRLASMIGAALERSVVASAPPGTMIEPEAASTIEAEQEIGFLDLLITVEEELNHLTAIASRLNDASTSLGASMTDRAEEMRRAQVADDGTRLRLFKKASDQAAKDMLQFVARVDEELPQFSVAFQKAFKSYRDALRIAHQFGAEPAQLTDAYETVRSLEASIAGSGESLAGLGTVISTLPPMSTALAKAKTSTAGAISRLSAEWNGAIELTSELQSELIALLPSPTASPNI